MERAITERKLAICKGIVSLPQSNIMDMNALKLILAYYDPVKLVEEFIHSFPRYVTDIDDSDNKVEVMYLSYCKRRVSAIGFGIYHYSTEFSGYPDISEDVNTDLPEDDSLPPAVQPTLLRSHAMRAEYQKLEIVDGKPHQWIFDESTPNVDSEIDFEQAFLVWLHIHRS